jgi:hypothetical protein
VNKPELDEDPATEQDTRNALLDKARRSAVPVRKSFVQVPPSDATDANHRAGPLADFVVGRDLRGLNAYLIALAAISSGDGENGWSATYPIGVWARAFGTTRYAQPSSAATAVSKTLRRLEQRGLIERARTGRARQIRIGLLREDGSGQAYTRPTGRGGDGELFVNLDHAYWKEGWCDRLKLPGLAMLLVALHEKPGFQLPAERVPGWYGWSADTAERGFAELEENRLLYTVRHRRKEPLSASGFGYVNRYYLTPPFGTTAGMKLLAAMVEGDMSFDPTLGGLIES